MNLTKLKQDLQERLNSVENAFMETGRPKSEFPFIATIRQRRYESGNSGTYYLE